MRIYSNYTQKEANYIKKMAAEIGMTPSSFQKYATCLYLHRDPGDRSSILATPNLISLMLAELSKLPAKTEFICSALFPPETWANLSPSIKRTLAYRLSQEVDRNPLKYQIVLHKRGQPNRYKKIS